MPRAVITWDKKLLIEQSLFMKKFERNLAKDLPGEMIHKYPAYSPWWSHVYIQEKWLFRALRPTQGEIYPCTAAMPEMRPLEVSIQ